MLEFNEEVAHVRHLFGFLFVSDDFNRGEKAFVSPANLIFELFLRVATWNVLDAEVGSQVLGLFDKINQHWLIVVVLTSSVAHVCRACVLRARCGLIARLLVRIWRLGVEAVGWKELVLATIVAETVLAETAA